MPYRYTTDQPWYFSWLKNKEKNTCSQGNWSASIIWKSCSRSCSSISSGCEALGSCGCRIDRMFFSMWKTWESHDFARRRIYFHCWGVHEPNHVFSIFCQTNGQTAQLGFLTSFFVSHLDMRHGTQTYWWFQPDKCESLWFIIPNMVQNKSSVRICDMIHVWSAGEVGHYSNVAFSPTWPLGLYIKSYLFGRNRVTSLIHQRVYLPSGKLT